MNHSAGYLELYLSFTVVAILCIYTAATVCLTHFLCNQALPFLAVSSSLIFVFIR